MENISDVRWLLQHLRPYSFKAFVALIMATGAGLISTIDPLLMRHLLDQSLPLHRSIDSAVCIVLIASCFIGSSCLFRFGALFSFRVAQSLGLDIRRELLAHMNRLSADWHEQTLLGEKLSRFDSDIEQIAQFAADASNTIVRIAVFFVLNFAIMLSMNVTITLTVLPFLPLFYLVRRRFRPLIQTQASHTQAGTGRAIGKIAEHLGAVPQLHLLGAAEYRIADSDAAWMEVVHSQWTQRRTESAFSVSVTSVVGLAILAVLAMGRHRYFAGMLTIGTIVAFYTYITRIFDPIATAMELYARSQRMTASARRVLEVLGTAPSVPDFGRFTEVVRTLEHGLRLEAVSFRYGPDRFVLKDIEIEIDPGCALAIVGPSGSGKSTLARLLIRLIDPTTGQVIVEQRAAVDYTLRALREIICYVPQSPILFRGSIRENLLYGNPAADPRQLDQAIHAAQLEPILQRLPLGLDHMLDANAAGLSGGEQQRLAVARALLRNSAVLILDESTSALDVPTEAALLQAVRRFRPEMTTVIISHRLRSLTWVDRFILLNNGTIAGEGDHATLMRESSLYRQLLDNEPVSADSSRSNGHGSTHEGSALYQDSMAVTSQRIPFRN